MKGAPREREREREGGGRRAKKEKREVGKRCYPKLPFALGKKRASSQFQ
jgi:hypothetical protein